MFSSSRVLWEYTNKSRLILYTSNIKSLTNWQQVILLIRILDWSRYTHQETICKLNLMYTYLMFFLIPWKYSKIKMMQWVILWKLSSNCKRRIDDAARLFHIWFLNAVRIRMRYHSVAHLLKFNTACPFWSAKKSRDHSISSSKLSWFFLIKNAFFPILFGVKFRFLFCVNHQYFVQLM